MAEPQHIFPINWLTITNMEVVAHLEYLLEHYKDYNITISDDNHLVIAGINFERHCEGTKYGRYLYPFPCFYINHQKICSDGNTDGTYKLCRKLFDICQQENKKQKG